MKKIIKITGVLLLAFVISCKTNPFTGKRTLNFYGNSSIFPMAFAQYDQFLEENKVVEATSEAKMITNVGQRIAIASEKWLNANGYPGYLKDYQWEYNLVQDKTVNAWCMPGGKIAVYTGILDATKNTNGLAAVMGHEIAHAVAKHSVERASRGTLLNVGTRIIDIASGGVLSDINRTTGQNTVGLLAQLGILNPFNRKQESEADYLGLAFASLTGYNLYEGAELWKRMKDEMGKEVPQFLSTHPSPDNRIRQIRNWIPQIRTQFPKIKNI